MAIPVFSQAGQDDRSPYMAAAAVVRTISRLSSELTNEDTVWEAFSGWRGGQSADYIQTIRRTQHSIFYAQLQHLYEFGIEKVPAQMRESFCFQSGRTFTEVTLGESIYPMLQVALAQPGQFQSTIIELIQLYLYRYAGNKYQLSAKLSPDEIVFTVEDRFAQLTAQYVQQYGLAPNRCLQNSMDFISGGIDWFASRVIRGYQGLPKAFQVVNGRGVIHLPVQQNNVFDYEGLLQTLLGFVQGIQARQNQEAEESQLESELVVASPLMRQTWNRVRRASQSDEAVLLLGESGTGKTFIAHKIHALSPRRQGPFIQVGLTSDLGSDNLIQSNLFGHERGAFTGATEQKQGLFSLANGGTILLDEIGDASPELQAKLLRVLDSATFRRLGGLRDIHVDVRVIAATHQPLDAMVREGKFRQDLYYRLNVIPIQVPALREQPESIPALAEFLLNRLNRSSRQPARKLPPGLYALLQRYPWPGNIRELEHALRHAVAMADGDSLKWSDFPMALQEYFQNPSSSKAHPTLNTSETSAPAIIDLENLQLAIRASDPKLVSEAIRRHELPCHVEYARKFYLAALIEEFHGDLSLIGHYWDHHSEKTLRGLIQDYGLVESLQGARARARKSQG